jgi:hypothetical protein
MLVELMGGLTVIVPDQLLASGDISDGICVFVDNSNVYVTSSVIVVEDLGSSHDDMLVRVFFSFMSDTLVHSCPTPRTRMGVGMKKFRLSTLIMGSW